MSIRNSTFFSATSTKNLRVPLFLLVALIAAPPEILAQGQANSKNASVCRSLSREWESFKMTLKRLNSTMVPIDQAGAAAERRFKSLRKSYDNARKSGNMKGARSLALQMDEAWAQLGDAARQGSSLTSTALQTMVNACATWQRGLKNGCVDKQSSVCSSAISYMRKHKSFFSAEAAKTSKSWRTKADYNFDDPKVLAACPEGQAVVPFPARIVSVKGRAFVVRGSRTLPAAKGMKLAGKDIVASEDGSLVTIYVMGSGELKITEKTKFEIPQIVYQPPAEPGLLEQGAQKGAQTFKRILQGESFEIKTPGGACVVRG